MIRDDEKGWRTVGLDERWRTWEEKKDWIT